MLLIMYQIFSSLLGHLLFSVHFLLYFYGVTFFGTPNINIMPCMKAMVELDPNRGAPRGGSVQPPTFSVGKMPLTVRSKMPLTVRGNVWEISITRSGSNNVVEMVFPIYYPLLQKNDFISNQVLYRSIFSKQLLVLTTKWLHQKEDIRG